MAGELVVGILYNLFLPLLLLAASLFRYNGLSVVYFVFLLTVPLLPNPSLVTMKGKTGQFLQLIVYTSLTLLSLQCLMQIPFSYIQPDVSGYWEDFFYHFGIVRFSLVDPGNIVRLLAPDLGILCSSIFVLRLCNKLTHPPPQVNQHENGILPMEAEEGETSESDSEEESDTEGSSFDSSDETTVPVQSGPPQFVQKLIVFAAGLKLLLSAIMNTAGKVVVTVLLGLAGVYFSVFLGLVWWWVFSRSISMLIFSSLCVMLTIFSGGHLLVLYLYQLPLSQLLVPPEDVYPRLFGMTGVIRTNSSEPYTLALHPFVSWPDFVNPLVLLLLYFTLVALLHKWVHITEEDTDDRESRSPAESPEAPPSFSRVIYISGDKQETECDVEVGNCEESLMTATEATSAPSGPSGLVIFGQMVQKHSYVSGLIIMMVNIQLQCVCVCHR
ncbi:unnamed protein product [Tetraodon nigroviridis]|uniref:(spotted green pufferfish) hypothetical protein n=1 Tax=Tetraodon nigroviridis TaxID=99883 RepID=Q4S7Z5_TETNG|nr:unnamed protein product [Tetraodon nigroviridis]